MKKWFKIELTVIVLILLASSIGACVDKTSANSTNTPSKKESISEEPPRKELSDDFKAYWYGGEAEITSYKLEQARYGEIRDGHAVLIYVTEPFLPEKQVKANNENPDNISVLKLNATKKYLTGIYPYSIMSSSFYPVYDNGHAVKLSTSVQEWCGHVYTQLNNREQFEVTSHSYFQSEADQHLKLEKSILENELWNKIRIDPKNLPVGDLEIIPSLEHLRVSHKEVRAYQATARLTENGAMSTYELNYPELGRTLTINFNTAFPYTIESWTDSFKSGFGGNAQTLVSKGTKIKTLKTPYWQKNGNKDVILRDSLGL